MHQPVESDPQRPGIVVDFDEVLQKMSDVEPKEAWPHMGYGRRLYIQAYARNSTKFLIIEIYDELRFHESPSDPDKGFTVNDVDRSKCISVTDVDMQEMPDGGHRSEGEVYTYDDFVQRYIKDETTKTKLKQLMEAMEDKNDISETLLEHVNQTWDSRFANDSDLFSVTVN